MAPSWGSRGKKSWVQSEAREALQKAVSAMNLVFLKWKLSKRCLRSLVTLRQRLAPMSEAGRREEAGLAPGKVNKDTVLPSFQNRGSDSSPSQSVSGGQDAKYDPAANKERDVEEQEEPSAFSRRVRQHSHLNRPLIHAALVLFGLGTNNGHRHESQGYLITAAQLSSSVQSSSTETIGSQ